MLLNLQCIKIILQDCCLADRNVLVYFYAQSMILTLTQELELVNKFKQF